jgi:ATP-dependent Clp protease ATP-binding subunit ClpA
MSMQTKPTKETIKCMIHIRSHANLESVKLRAAHCGSEELLLEILCEERSLAAIELRRAGLSKDSARSAIKELFDCKRSGLESALSGFSGPPKSDNFEKILNKSEQIAFERGDESIQLEHILIALLMKKTSGAAYLLDQCGIDRGTLYEQLLKSMDENRQTA